MNQNGALKSELKKIGYIGVHSIYGTVELYILLVNRMKK